jgi:predicted ArsR family transcriptional regulator
MFYGFGTRQQQLLSTLLEHKSGLTVDELCKQLEITRTAVNQHLLALERSGYIAKDKLTRTGGRPGHTYILTTAGHALFPKQYAWFSRLLLESLEAELGKEGLKRYLDKLGAGLSDTLQTRVQGLTPEQRLSEVVAILEELGYDADLEQTPEQGPAINAHNCVYHDLAKTHNEVCQFDISLLKSLLGADIEHKSCMARGDDCCRFVPHFKPPAK